MFRAILIATVFILSGCTTAPDIANSAPPPRFETVVVAKNPKFSNAELPSTTAPIDTVAYRQNLTRCLEGRYPKLCNHNLLSASDLQKVRVAEYNANLRICLDGRYPSLCHHSILTEADRVRVAKAKSATKTYTSTGPHCAENGSCYGDISANTGRAKTVHVGGYYRRDGTYVRGHYRSRPRR